MTEVKVPRGRGVFELVEKRSKFIGVLSPVDGEQAALDCLGAIKANHREATHNVYAYRLLEGQLMRYSDDGEPQGTAGMPVLEVLRREDIHNVLCVVTRYFGGTLLGAGGLVRAYAAAAKGALDEAGTAVLMPLADGTAQMPYTWYEQVRRLLDKSGAHIGEVGYAELVTISFKLPESGRAGLEAGLIELTAGQVRPVWQGVALGMLPQTGHQTEN